MTHPNLEAQLDAYLDGELAAADARALEAHIAQCPECARWRDDRVTLRAAKSSTSRRCTTARRCGRRSSASLRPKAEPPDSKNHGNPHSVTAFGP